MSVRMLAVIAAFAGSLMADPLADVMARMDKAAEQFRAMTADITDVEHTAVVNVDETMKGSYKIRRAKGETRMLIEFTGAEAKAISLEGAQVKVYYPKINTEQVYNIGDKRNLVDEFLLLGFGATGKQLGALYDVSYVGAENIAGQATSRIRLVPQSKDMLRQLKQAELWIADTSAFAGLPVQQKFTTSSGGDFKLVTYTNLRLNPALNDKDLKLNPPKGVQIQQMHN